ncbi:MAG: aminopeptidase P family protein [Solirubrobacterales bacterium]|nr:aminopeptidase P family protein [Solirubrobacterales bacterium]
MRRARAERLVELLDEADLDVALIGELVNVRYLTGYTGTNGLALIGAQTRTFITDFRYLTQAAEEVHPTFQRIRAPLDLLDAVPDALPGRGLRLGFEEEHMSVARHRRLLELLGDRAELVAVKGLVERLRAVKEPEEIELIKAATTLADAAFERLLRDGLIGRTEREVAIALEHDMRERGAERPSFETIVAAGAHGALPHARPRDVPIRQGELVVIDWGAQCGGYCSDCTRTVAAGEPGEESRALYELVLQAQQSGLEAVRAGSSGRETDAAARAVIEAGGQGDHFGHGLGHGVGIDIHEGPRLSQRSEDTLSASNVVTVEPGVYLPERFGIRIEDLVVVTEEGCEILTSVPKRLLVIE